MKFENNNEIFNPRNIPNIPITQEQPKNNTVVFQESPKNNISIIQ
jgi:hypothetical protein